MKTRKRFMAFFLTLVMVVTALMPNGLVFAADMDSRQETDGFYYNLDYALSEDKMEETMTLTLQEKEDVTIQEVILPDGEAVTYTGQPVTYTVSENRTGNFTVRYTKIEAAEPAETESDTEIFTNETAETDGDIELFTDETQVTEPQTETSDLAVQETVLPFEVTDIPQVETEQTQLESETETNDDVQMFSSEAKANTVVTTFDELKNAIANANDGDTINIIGTIMISEQLRITKSITLTGGTLINYKFIGNNTGMLDVSGTNTNVIFSNIILDGNKDNIDSKSALISLSGESCTAETQENTILKNAYAAVGSAFLVTLEATENTTIVINDGTQIFNNLCDNGGNIGGWQPFTFIMNGGEIKYNRSNSNGAGVYLLGMGYEQNMIMNGGIISNNISANIGGGVTLYGGPYLNGSGGQEGNGGFLKLSGNAQILNNEDSLGKTNLLLYETKKAGKPIIKLSDSFSGKIGITTDFITPISNDNFHTALVNGGYNPTFDMCQNLSGISATFFSDKPDYITRLVADDDNYKIVLGFPKITYHLRGGDFTDSTEETFYTIGNQPISKPSDPYFLDHAFVNWYSTADTSDSGTIFDFNTPIGKDTDIYARWYPDVYAISFDPNGGTGSMDDIEHNGGTVAVDLPANTFTRAGHTFTGWNTSADGTGTPVDNETAGYVAGSKNITLYAQWNIDSYDVTFDSKGGSAVGSINDVPYGGTITAPAAPTNTGYTFDGWYKDEAYTAAWDFGSDTVLSDITLYAKWTQKEYTVKYDAGFDEFAIADKTGVHYYDADLVRTPLIKAGYSFGGWKYQDDYLTEATSYAQCAKDDTLMEITLVAQWLPIEYTVKYDTKGTGTIADKTGVLFDDKNLLPADPAKTGYDFTGWKLDTVEVTQDTTYSSLVDSDRVMEVTLTAQWQLKDYTVKYDTKGAGTIADKTGVHFTDKNLLPADPMKAGYNFDGWMLGDVEVTSDKTYSSLVADDTVMEIMLVAQWTAKDYTVQYDTKGGNLISDKTGILFTDSGLLPADPIKAGYTFAGWKLGDIDVLPETAYNSLVADDTIMEVTLEAQWTAKEYTVKYDTKGADAIADKTGVHFTDKNLLPTDPVKAGFTFTGWKLVDVDVTKDITYSSLVADDKVMEITLEAQWTAKEYMVKYDTQGAGTIADKTGVKYADASLLPTDALTKDGFTFLGWKYGDITVSDANTYESLAKDDTLPSITLVAEWKENVYKVNYETGFEDVIVAAKENVKWNDSNLLPESPKKDGYGFIGWKLADKQVTATDKYNSLTTDQTDGSSITLKADWVKLKDYSVLYNTNGGSMPADTPSSITGMMYDDTVPTPTPIRTGFTFKGWIYKDASVKDSASYKSLAKDDTIKQLELVAQWEENSYTVKYDTKGGNAIDSKAGVKFDDNGLLPAKDPVNAGYTFKGWLVEDTAVVDATRYNELVANDTVKSVTLTAQWEINKYTVDFKFTSDKNPDGISVPKGVTVEYGSKTDEPKFTAPTNWIFDGWYTDKECKQKYDFSTPITGNIILYGKWAYKTPDTPKPEKPAKPSKPTTPTTPSTPDNAKDAPKTGDTTNLALFIALFGISASLLLLLVGKRKKQRDL